MATSRQLREQIAAGRWDATLAALYGGSEEVLARQRSRYGAALEQFELYYGPGRQVQVYSAPGRTELGGNHTDHQHGYGLAGAVTLDLVAVASRNEDGFYSELCSKRSRGLARVWTLEREGNIICTVGAYALANGQAYMACGETVEALRGKGVGGRLIVEMANALAAEGWMPVFLCSPERVHFYTRLGFEKMGEYARYEVQ